MVVLLHEVDDGTGAKGWDGGDEAAEAGLGFSPGNGLGDLLQYQNTGDPQDRPVNILCRRNERDKPSDAHWKISRSA